MKGTTAETPVFGTAPEAKTKSSMKSLFIKQKQIDGRKMPIIDAAGKDTGEYILVRGHFSDEVSSAFESYQRARVANDAKPENERVPLIELSLLSRVSMVVDWSFAEPCTKENVTEFLQNAPNVAIQIDQFSWVDKNFL